MNKLQLPLLGLNSVFPVLTYGQTNATPSDFSLGSPAGLTFIVIVLLLAILITSIIIRQKVQNSHYNYKRKPEHEAQLPPHRHLRQLNSRQMSRLLTYKKHQRKSKLMPVLVVAVVSMVLPWNACAQVAVKPDSSLLSEAGILITIILLLIPILLALILIAVKLNNALRQSRNKQQLEEADRLVAYLQSLSEDEMQIGSRKRALDFQLNDTELSGTDPANDRKGLLEINDAKGLPIVASKKKALPRPNIDPGLSKMILWYLGCATFWLLFGTTVGEYLGIKFVAPDVDQVSWLSFGRLRPVHTNAVFWGWASLGMLGLGYYIVPRVGNVALASIRYGWYSLWLINISVVAGTLCLMAGINNGGGEYREYVWPVMLPFAVAIALTLYNYLKTIGRRTTKEIYISNWYIVSAIIFTLVIVAVAYIPYWQNGLGETIVQGYYMHQGVGMWFMLFTLGMVYYFLPQQLNKPIYSYSLGILAFWTQILFYTLIGTHHFVFSAIPWWLQTVAIVGSAGMAIPVIAGTTNFLLTFKGAWYKIKDSYTLPFFLVGIIFYFTGSMQGTAEAFRTTNLIWHFTDFTVAHSHLTMYGIICFFLWACIYAVIPRLTGKEAPQITIGAHFWLAFIGMLFYTIPLMYGSTLRGLMWIEGKAFIDSVTLMAPYWLWRAIGGSLMWLSHICFAYNMYKMWPGKQDVDIRESAISKLEQSINPVTVNDNK